MDRHAGIISLLAVMAGLVGLAVLGIRQGEQSVSESTLRVAQLRACHRLNVERARNNRDWYRTYIYDHTFLQLVIAGLKHQTSQVKRTAEQEHATKLFVSKLRDNVRALQWIALTDCLAATDYPLAYIPPVPVSFSEGLPPMSALHAGSEYAPPESARRPDGYAPAKRPLTITPFKLAPRHIDAAGLHLIEGFEGYSRCAYWDPFGRVYTVGFGQTNLFGRSVPSGFCFANRGAAEANLRYSVESEYEWALRPLNVTTEHEWDALCSFAYNLGAGIFTGSLREHLQRHELRAAGDEMLGYDHAGGQVLEGLRIRREAEVRVMLEPERPSACQRHPTICRDLKARRAELAAITAHMRKRHCLVRHPRRACGGLYRHRTQVRRLIRHLERELH